MTTSTDNSLDISAQLFWQSTTPTSSATQTESAPALSQSGSTSAPDIYTSCPNRVSGSATGKKNFTWSSADVLCLITIIYDSTPVEPNRIKAKLRWCHGSREVENGVCAVCADREVESAEIRWESLSRRISRKSAGSVAQEGAEVSITKQRPERGHTQVVWQC
ncbi:uncharacterized protein UHOD_11391 [Ustilago sp. UG-2017b]|nr:uncharacterized protein UHOD_11391 [Ustilago sp. UG-2017b]